MSNEHKSKDFQEVFQFPFRIKSNLHEFNINEDFQIRKMDDELKERLFGIRNLKYGDNGLLCGFTSNWKDDRYEIVGPLFVALQHLQSSNYVLTTSVPERANELNLALKLIGDSSTSLFVGFSTHGSQHYIPQCFFNFHMPALTVTKKEALSLKELVFQIHNSNDDIKFQIMSDIYIHAMSDKIRPGSRFIELFVTTSQRR